MIDKSEFVGGDPSLDFVNTIGGIRSGENNDNLNNYEDLVEWAAHSGTMSAGRRASLRALAHSEPRAAERVLLKARALREAMHAVFAALTHGKQPPRAPLVQLNEAIGQAMAHALVRRRGDTFDWGWDDAVTLDSPLWPIARAAGELLVSQRVDRLRECASERCGWLFLDTSKNRSRRWCDMKGCGNRAKVRRYRGLAD